MIMCLPIKLVKNTLLTVSKMIAITNTDRKATIAIAIGDFFSDGDRDRDRNFAIGVMS